MSWRRSVVIGGLATLAAMTVYLLTLAPDITWSHDGGDGGDLITAVMSGGVPHPPGYPSYLLLTGPLARLPLGNPAWRLNLFSAFAAAGAAGLIAVTVVRMAERARCPQHVAEAAGISAGLALAFSPVLWSQAVIAEVYALGALFTALLFLVGAATREATGRDCFYRVAALGAVMGLALGAHPPLILLGLLAPLVLGRLGRSWFWAGFGFAAGLAVFLVLPVRARSGSPVNWGDASTLNGFWWLVSAQLYHGYVFALPLSSLGARLVAWAAMMARQFTPVGALLAVWGLWQLIRPERGLAFAMLAMFVGWSVFAIGYNTTDSYVYLIPVFVLAAVWLGVGAAEVLSRTRWPLVLKWCAALALPLVQLVVGWSAADAHLDRTAVTFGQAILEQAPPNAILLTAQDKHTFTLWYYRYVRAQRPDVTIVDRDLLALPWYRTTVAHETGLRDLDVGADPLAILAASERPMCQVSSTSLECP